jgi:hypothetical protein
MSIVWERISDLAGICGDWCGDGGSRENGRGGRKKDFGRLSPGPRKEPVECNSPEISESSDRGKTRGSAGRPVVRRWPLWEGFKAKALRCEDTLSENSFSLRLGNPATIRRRCFVAGGALRRIRRVQFEGNGDVRWEIEFDWSFNPSIPRKQVFDLATCRFVREGE